MEYKQYGESVSFDHEPRERERKMAVHRMAQSLLPFLERDGVIYKKVVVDGEPVRWTVGVKFLIQK